MKTTKYLRSNTYAEMPLNHNGQTRGFAFVTAPNNIHFSENNLVIEGARSKIKTAKTIEPLYQVTSSCEPFSRASRCVQWI